MRRGAPARHAGPVAHHPARRSRRSPERPGRGTPEGAALLVAQEDRLRCRVGDRVVRERRQAVLAAALAPRVGGPRGGHDAPEARVRKDVDPGKGCLPIALEDDDVLAAVGGEAAQPVHHDEAWRPDRLVRLTAFLRLAGRQERGREHRLQPRAVELRGQAAAVSREDGLGDGLEEDRLRLRHRVGSQQKYPSLGPLPGAPRTRVEELGQLLVQLVAIAGEPLVQDHGVRLQPLQAPELVRLQDVPHELEVLRRAHPHENDWEVARDAVTPEPGLAERVLGESLLVGPKRRVREEDA